MAPRQPARVRRLTEASKHATAHALIALIYDAALDPRLWPSFLESYADAIGAASTALLYHDVREHRGTISASIRVAETALNLYNQHFFALDPWLYAAEERGRLRTGAVVLDEDVVSRAELKRTEYYNDFARRHGITRMIGGVIRRDGRITASISSQRPDSKAAFADGERSLLALLLPHLFRAMQVHGRLTAGSTANAALQQTLESLAVGVIVLQGASHICFANTKAEHILAARDGLVHGSGGLRALLPSENSRLQALLTGAQRTMDGSSSSGGGSMSISRPSMKRSFILLVTPTGVRADEPPFAIGGSMVAVFISDPEDTHADEDLTRTVWGLTPTQARVAAALAAGRTVQEIADHLRASTDTVRWHIKQALSRTGARRQADLVRLVLAGAAVRRRR